MTLYQKHYTNTRPPSWCAPGSMARIWPIQSSTVTLTWKIFLLVTVISEDNSETWLSRLFIRETECGSVKYETSVPYLVWSASLSLTWKAQFESMSWLWHPTKKQRDKQLSVVALSLMIASIFPSSASVWILPVVINVKQSLLLSSRECCCCCCCSENSMEASAAQPPQVQGEFVSHCPYASYLCQTLMK